MSDKSTFLYLPADELHKRGAAIERLKGKHILRPRSMRTIKKLEGLNLKPD